MEPLPVSLCMIAKNEAANLSRHLPVMAPWCEEFIFVDTGSTDQSVSLARQFGARIFTKEWQNDFASVRNFALAQASRPWILVLDADEVVSPRDYPRMQEALNNHSDAGGFVFRQRSYLVGYDHENWMPNHTDYDEGRSYRGYMDASVVRLFVNAPDVRYTGASHDLVEYSLKDRLKWDTQIPIHHYGMTGEDPRHAEKDLLYLEQIEKDRKAHPEIFKTHFTYGRQLYRMGRYSDALEAFETALKLRPDSDYAYLNLGMTLVQLKRYNAAKHSLLQSLQLRQANPEAWNALGISLAFAKEYNEALRCFNEAVKCNPENPKFINNRITALIHQNQLDEALRQIQVLLQVYPDYVLAWLNRLRIAKILSDEPNLAIIGRHILKLDSSYAASIKEIIDQ